MADTNTRRKTALQSLLTARTHGDSPWRGAEQEYSPQTDGGTPRRGLARPVRPPMSYRQSWLPPNSQLCGNTQGRSRWPILVHRSRIGISSETVAPHLHLFGFGSGFGGACIYAKQERSCQLSNMNGHVIRGQVNALPRGGSLLFPSHPTT